MASKDYCRGIRKTYSALLNLFASNNLIVGIIAGLPIYYIVGLIIIYHKTYEWSLFYGANYSCLSVLAFSWICALVCIWRMYPNGLTVSIFILKALGYWAFVSTCILLFYGAAQLPRTFTAYLFASLAPQIGLLLFTADVLRALRSRFYAALETARTVATAPTVVV
jgi:hypothetical protein